MNKYHKQVLKRMENNEKNAQKLLENAYNKAWFNLEEELIREYAKPEKPGTTYNIQRLQTLQKKVEEAMNNLYADSQDIIIETGEQRYIDARLGEYYEIEKQLGASVNWTLFKEEDIRRAVLYEIDDKTIIDRMGNVNLPKVKRELKDLLIQQTINNKGYREVAKELSDRLKIDERRALDLVVTEGGRIASLARLDAQDEADDLGINFTKTWVSTLDNATRPYHQDLDGQTVKHGENFEIAGYSAEGPRLFGAPEMDIWCRCDITTNVEGLKPGIRRDNITKEIIEYKTYNEWREEKDKEIMDFIFN